MQGDDVSLKFTIKDKSETIVDLTGILAASFKIFDNFKDSAILEKTLGAGITNAAPTTGVLTVTLTDSDTGAESLLAGEHYFELKFTDAAGLIKTMRGFDGDLGIFEILESI